MFSKLVSLAAIVVTLSAHAHAHAAIAPVLGVSGAPVRNDVQKPSKATPCGTTNIAANIDTSTPVAAAADGTFTTTATNFNAGKDGSRQVTLQVDSTGVGKTFVAGTVSQNGQLAPTNVGSEPIVAALPAGTKCTGGAAGNLCLASFTTAGGFGNCVVVSQGAAAGSTAAASNSTAAAAGGDAAASNSTSADAAASSSTTTSTTGAAAAANGTKAHHHHKGAAGAKAGAAKAGAAKAKAAAGAGAANAAPGNVNAAKAAAGTRAPRARRAQLEEGSFQVVKRNILNWVWA